MYETQTPEGIISINQQSKLQEPIFYFKCSVLRYVFSLVYMYIHVWHVLYMSMSPGHWYQLIERTKKDKHISIKMTQDLNHADKKTPAGMFQFTLSYKNSYFSFQFLQ